MKLLWIGAHPDDELFAAPWLGKMKDEGAECAFLLATRGEAGKCVRPMGCQPDLGTVRTEEMEAAARLFAGRLWFADCPDGTASEPEDVLRSWERSAGGRDALHRRFTRVIADFAPDRIVTFDPRHGCTWHADHRALGMLVQRLALDIPITLVQSRIAFSSPLAITPGRRTAIRVDSASTWHYLLADLQCHSSQFTPAVLELFRAVPDEERVIWLLHRSKWRRWDPAIDGAERLTRRLPGLRHLRKSLGWLLGRRDA
ncbi:MAG TPA: PIG-L family deacetylase [Thermoanaerobaculia bacterium]|jgi:LmbE family N-acetylglucosaminyl deacetylase|nr:PIG-L family deacetylase [Thermoanaerobaculia bacterium]